MRRQIFTILLAIYLTTTCYSQSRDTLDTCNKIDVQRNEDVAVFIKGKKGKDRIIWRFFYKKFELQLSDPSFEIVRFAITWDNLRKNMIVQRINFGKTVETDLENSDLPDKQNYSLKNIAPGSLITFDNIVVRKEGLCYKAKSFAIWTYLRKKDKH